jgi:SAM-dependent methyltransferase
MDKDAPAQLESIKRFYDAEYYRDSRTPRTVTGHYRRLAERLDITARTRVLDVACGRGDWLLAARERGATVAGIDLSDRAIGHCREAMPDGEFAVGPAETLPFADMRFNLVTCLGSLEHFVDKPGALREMQRVATPDARFLLLVPNAGFLTRRLGLYGGTNQKGVKEDVYALDTWAGLFADAGLAIDARWADLHVLSWEWVRKSHPAMWPLRALQALALTLWPLGWQYQVFFLCHR